jgi:hypothetical protein
MNRLVLSFATLGAFTLIASAAIAEPVKLSNEQLDQVVAGAITTTQVNGGGNTPNGNANGVPTVSVNPTGKAPPGQNK